MKMRARAVAQVPEVYMHEMRNPEMMMQSIIKTTARDALSEFVGQPLTQRTLEAIGGQMGALGNAAAATGNTLGIYTNSAQPIRLTTHIEKNSDSTVSISTDAFEGVYYPTSYTTNLDDPTGTATQTVTYQSLNSIQSNSLSYAMENLGTFPSATAITASTPDTFTVEHDITYGSNIGWSHTVVDQAEAKRQLFKEKIERQLNPPIADHRGRVLSIPNVHPFQTVTTPEIVALKLLKGLVGPMQFRQYLRKGRLTVRGESGMDYVMHKGRTGANVLFNGELVASLCIHLANESNLPPTDITCAKVLMVQVDEARIWRESNANGYPKTENARKMGRLFPDSKGRLVGNSKATQNSFVIGHDVALAI